MDDSELTGEPEPGEPGGDAAGPDSPPGQPNVWKRSARLVGESAAGLTRSAVERVDDATRSVRAARLVADLEDRIAASRRERKMGKGTLRATYVEAYRGFVSQRKAHIRVRVMEEPVIPEPARIMLRTDIMQANIRRFVALQFPGVHVRVRMGDFFADAVTDRRGYATVQLPAVDLEPGWHEYSCATVPEAPGEEPARASGFVLVPDPAAGVTVISDVDDTVLKTGLSEGLSAVRRTLFGNARTRRAIPGMAHLYRMLEDGAGDGTPPPAFFYLSTGPWALYDVLIDFLDYRGFPNGVLLLTDWAPQERYIARSGREHKRANLRRLFTDYPDTSFVLIGDSGQKDPGTYTEAAREFPDRVRAIVILDVGEHMAERAAELTELAPQLRADGIPFHFVADAGEAARVFADVGLLVPPPEPEPDAKAQAEADAKAAKAKEKADARAAKAKAKATKAKS